MIAPGDMYRNKKTGQLGELSTDEYGKKWVKPSGSVEMKEFREDEWELNVIERELSRFQIAAIQYAAHRQLCAYLGFHADAKLRWDELTNEKRRTFMYSSPEGELFRRLYFAIAKILDPEEKYAG